MESINETPPKKRKLEGEFVSKGYDSQDDSGDDVFDTFNTVATLPLPTTQFMTQPTQILEKVTSPHYNGESEAPTVQVQASSPARSSPARSPAPPAPPSPRPVRGFATSLAPAGTCFRPPAGIVKNDKSLLIQGSAAVEFSDDDDDGPRYQGGSSDDESQVPKADIKPSVFKVPAQKVNNPSGVDKLRQITAKAVYNPNDSSRSGDMLANAYGGARRKPISRLNQSGPPKAIQTTSKPAKDIPLESIADHQMRTKIKKMREILPSSSVLKCREALLNKKNNYDDALDFLAAQGDETDPIDLTADDDYGNVTAPENRTIQTMSTKSVAKQQLKAPAKKIHEKWATTQIPQPVPSSPPKQATPASKPRKRLMQGRKRDFSPLIEPQHVHASPKRSVTPDSDTYDSGLGQEQDEDLIEGRVLKFFNTCSIPNLVDTAAVSDAIAQLILSLRPFPSLDSIREITEGSSKDGKGKAKRPKLIGDKIVDKCLDMWRGYEAVDTIIQHCSKLGQPMQKAMSRWGVDPYSSANKDGELEIVDIETVSNATKDSGIGTPTSRSVSVDEDGDVNGSKPLSTSKKGFFVQPSNLAASVSLKDYQIVGVNWLALLFEHSITGAILADDMGLGKTCQVIAFLAHLKQQGVRGPHLIIVPSSTLENWLREFSIFCPDLNILPYHANQRERSHIQRQIEDEGDSINAIITTYRMAATRNDNKFLRKLKPVCCVYDEGHMLKNGKSTSYEMYMRIPATFRLLLTGTPLQNNLQELVSLLGFILPSVFEEHRDKLEVIFNHKARTTENEQSHAALLSSQRISRAKSMMAPFVLRRKKHQVLKHIPQKHRNLEYCEMSESQKYLYNLEKNKALQVYARRQAGLSTNNESANIMMALRKASIHPLLFRRLYSDQTLKKMAKACLKESKFSESNVDLVFEDFSVMDDIELHLFCEEYPTTMSEFALQNQEWMDSGKVEVLTKLLQRYKGKGDKILIFSQFTMVMNIMELVLESLAIRFFRMDGQTKIEERQTMIDEFHEDESIPVFLLSTKAGGAGINLACANKVIIFDSSFNPQDDIQAENRAHRVGQTREVEVVRLVTRDTIEEQIHALGQTKLALDDRIAGLTDEGSGDQAEKQGKKMVEEMLKSQIVGEMHEGTTKA